MNKFCQFSLGLLCTLAFTQAVLAAENLILDDNHSYVQWRINHLGFSTQTGKCYLSGTLTLDKNKPENTDKGRKKFQEDVEKIHHAFRDYVFTHRSQLDIDKVSTGEHWLAVDAYDLKLIDYLKTSDDYLIEKMATHKAFKIAKQVKQSFASKLLKPAMKLCHPFA